MVHPQHPSTLAIKTKQFCKAIISEWYNQLKGEGGSITIANPTAGHSNYQPLSPISAGDATPMQSVPPYVGQSNAPQIHHSQQQR